MVTDEQRTAPPVRDKPPCAFCPPEEKYLACHDTCEKFAKWKTNVELVRENRRKYYESLPKNIYKFVEGK